MMKELIIGIHAVPHVVNIIRRGLETQSCPPQVADELREWCRHVEKDTIKQGGPPLKEEIFLLGDVDPYVRRALDLYRDGVFYCWEDAMMMLVMWLLHRAIEAEEQTEKSLKHSMVHGVAGILGTLGRHV